MPRTNGAGKPFRAMGGVWLMLVSFLIPIGLWCLLTYVPWFQGYMKLTVTVEKVGDLAVYAVGDRVEKSYFGEYTDQIRAYNQQVVADRTDGVEHRSSRTNKKCIRQIRPVAEAEGWLNGIDESDIKAIDAALLASYGELAEGTIAPTVLKLSDENLAIIRDNWSVIGESEQPDIATLTRKPLAYLIPQGVSASPVFLPAPHECFQAAWRDFTRRPDNNMPWMHERLLSSLKVVFGAFALSCLIGVPIGLLCGTYKFFAKIIEPFTDFFRYMPAPTFGLLLQAIFGIYGAPKIALVFVGTFPHMVLMLGNTTRLLDRSLLEAAQTLGATNKVLIRRVVIPGVMPKIYNDLRVLLGWAWTWLVIAELIGEKSGLTDFIVTQGGKYNFDRVFPVIIMIGVIGFGTDQLLQSLARKLFPWEYPHSRPGLLKQLIGLFMRQPKPSVEADDASAKPMKEAADVASC